LRRDDTVRILVTRPLDEAQRTANLLKALGHEALVAPVLRIELLTDAVLGAGPWSAVLMTSGNAARALMAHARSRDLTGLPVFAVGRQTAQAARLAGFSNVISSDGDSADLVRLAAARVADRKHPLLYLAGNDIARDLAGDLAARGLGVETVVLYRAEAADAFAEDVRRAIRAGEVDAVLHYSRRSTAIFVDCAGSAGLLREIKALTHCCLSDRAAEPLKGIGAADIRVARKPEEEALIDLLLHS
jgi:uroporphyrinogen-III synthase